MLPDGTNEEGEAVKPIEFAMDEVEDIVLQPGSLYQTSCNLRYQSEYSPPCVKLKQGCASKCVGLEDAANVLDSR